jgi:hypothetical protein
MHMLLGKTGKNSAGTWAMVQSMFGIASGLGIQVGSLEMEKKLEDDMKEKAEYTEEEKFGDAIEKAADARERAGYLGTTVPEGKATATKALAVVKKLVFPALACGLGAVATLGITCGPLLGQLIDMVLDMLPSPASAIAPPKFEQEQRRSQTLIHELQRLRRESIAQFEAMEQAAGKAPSNGGRAYDFSKVTTEVMQQSMCVLGGVKDYLDAFYRYSAASTLTNSAEKERAEAEEKISEVMARMATRLAQTLQFEGLAMSQRLAGGVTAVLTQLKKLTQLMSAAAGDGESSD